MLRRKAAQCQRLALPFSPVGHSACRGLPKRANFTTTSGAILWTEGQAMAAAKMSWEELGRRVAEARRIAGFSQEQLGKPLGLDRSAVSRIESGARGVDSLELSQISAQLERPIEWFIRQRPPTIISRRASRAAGKTQAGDLVLEDLVADVELLVEQGVLDVPASIRRAKRVKLANPKDAERLAQAARKAGGIADASSVDLVEVAERLGLLVFLLDVAHPGFDGSYVALPSLGVALVAGGLASGKRRFTIAHELGHHFLEDEFDTFVDSPAGRGKRERLVDAFAVHFLLPRKQVTQRFRELVATEPDLRLAALHLGAEYGVSWTALCGQLKNLELIKEPERRRLSTDVPTRAEFLERGLQFRPERTVPVLPTKFAGAVIRAYRGRKISAGRAVQMLRGSLGQDELPVLRPVPIEALAGDFEDEK